MSTITCPEPEELRQLIDGSLSGERQRECTEHMDSCECCQAKLEALAVGGTNLSQIVERAYDVEPIDSSAYWPALKELSADPNLSETFVPRTTPRSKDVSLQFLEPATDPAYIGRLAHFDVMRVIGRGGMGVVLEAFDSKLQRNVALKVLDPDLAHDELSRQRFCREARAAASVTHENVVAVHQVEKSSGANLPYLVMQLIGGESLEQRLGREKKLPLREIVRIAMEAAHGLVAAHGQGLIHRDIKPGNILLEPPTNRVKLTDFGLARVADDVKLTRTGFVTGTPLYMAPEQALGNEADYRSDLFSFGAILYEMCSGEPPFAGNSALAILKQIAETKHRPLRDVNPEIPEWLANTIDRLLEKKPEDRIQTAAQLAELLDYEWALMKTSTEDVPVVCQIEIRKRARRNQRIAMGVGATFLALGLFAGAMLTMPGKSSGPAQVSPEHMATLSANAGAVWSVTFDPQGKTVAMAVEDGTVRLWNLSDQSVTATLNAHRGNIWSLKYSHDGQLLATAGDDGLIKFWSPPQSESISTLENPNAVRGIVFSNDDQHLFAGSKEGGLRTWNLKTADASVEANQLGTIYAIAVSPNNETVATAGSDKIVRLWNAKTLTQKLPLEGHTAPVYGVTFNRDGRRLASAGWDRTIRIWDTGSGMLVKSWSGHSGDIWSIEYSPDGSRLASGGTDGSVKVWDAESGKLLKTLSGHENAVHSISFNQSGTQLASGGRDGTVRIWNLE